MTIKGRKLNNKILTIILTLSLYGLTFYWFGWQIAILVILARASAHAGIEREFIEYELRRVGG